MNKALKEALVNYNSFLIAGHYNPDGDCIGSTLAMALYLKSQGKEVTLYNKDVVPNAFKFLKGIELFTQNYSDKNYDCLIMIDNGEKNRIHPDFERFGGYNHTICIDHHITTNKDLFDSYHIDSDASSSGELVYDILKSMPDFELTKEIAECVYVAIMTDTGSFKHANTTQSSFHAAAELMEAGASPKYLADSVYRCVPVARIKLFQRALDSIEFFHNDKIAFMYLYLKDYKETNATPDLSEEFINEILAVSTVEAAVLVKEKDLGTQFKISMRSREKIDVASICKSHGGGGHRLAAGATFNTGVDKIKEILIRDILNQL